MSIQILPAYDFLSEIRELFAEYTDMLVEHDPSFQEYLTLQNYSEELDHPFDKYGPPDGRIYLAKWNDAPAGCIALRRLDKDNCEMKRLFVRPEFRNLGIGSQLIQRILADTREIGYHSMLLDTLPFLERAIEMYRRIGFQEIPIYNNSPMSSAIYMQLDL